MRWHAIFLSLLLSGSAYALPIGNPAEPGFLTESLVGKWWMRANGSYHSNCLEDLLSVRAGFYGDYVFNRNLEVHDGDDDDDIHKTTLNTNAGYLVFNYCNLVEGFATLGATRIHIETPIGAFAPANPNQFVEIDFETHFSWSLGLRAIVFEWECFTVGVEGQYFYTRPNIVSITEDTEAPVYLEGEHLKYQEWQGGVGLSRRFFSSSPVFAFIPYLGVKWAGARADMGNLVVDDVVTGFELKDLREKKLWGYCVGLSATLCERIAVSAERRFGDEDGLQVVGQIRF